VNRFNQVWNCPLSHFNCISQGRCEINLSTYRLTLFALVLLIAGVVASNAQEKKHTSLSEAKPANSSESGNSSARDYPQTTSGTSTQTTTKNGSSNMSSPLTPSAKLSLGLRQAFLNPGGYAGPAFAAFITERRNVKAPGKTGGDNFADGLSFYARYFAERASAQFLGVGLYPAIFKQDPRYYPSPKRTTGARLLYAISRVMLTRGDNGRTQFNFSGVAGNLTSAGLANFYERNTVASRDRFGHPLTYHYHIGVGPTFSNFAQTTAFDALGYAAFDEFDLLGKAGRKIRRLFGGH
jgi:hypothetical protein